MCIVALLAAIWSGTAIFGFGHGASTWLHVLFLASVLVFLAAILVLINRGASLHFNRSPSLADESNRPTTSDTAQAEEQAVERTNG